MQAFILRDNIDQPFIQQLEAKNEGIHFARIDAESAPAVRLRLFVCRDASSASIWNRWI